MRDLLTIQGYNHPSELEKASSCLAPGDYLYNTKPRKKEFDIEHMESALECGAELFITNDKRTILNLLEQALAVKHYPAEHPIAYMHSIAKLPSIAWNILTSAIE